MPNRQFLMQSPGLSLLVINGGVALAWGISLLLQKLGIPYLSSVTGILALFLPGLCLAVLLDQVSESKTPPLVFVLWNLLITFVLTPTAVFGISQIVFHQSPITTGFTAFLLWWAVIFLLTALVIFFKRQPSVFRDWQITAPMRRELTWSIGGFTIIMVINFLLYRFLPEGDTYSYLLKLEAIQANPVLLTSETRSIFLVFVHLASQVLDIHPYWIFKIFIPLGHVSLVLSCYYFARKFISDSRARVLFSLSPLFFPVVLQEALIGRPQSFFLMAILPVLVIISDILAHRTNIRQVYWFIVLIGIGGIGIKVHSLFTLIAIIGFISLLLFLWPYLRRKPIDSILIAAGIIILVLPSMLGNRLVPDSVRLIQLFTEAFTNGHFRFWFIDHYRNVDGTEVGWPGALALFYYGYNIGFALPVLLIWLVARKNISTLKQLFRGQYWAIIFLLLFLVFIAEIAPRFQIAYLPDRAWLFIAVIFALILPILMSDFVKKMSQRVFILLSMVCVISVGAGSALTYVKQGWVMAEEVEAARFIQSHTPPNSIFLGPGSSRFMIRYYAKRVFVHPPADVFLSGEKSALETYLEAKATPQDTPEVLNIRKRELRDALNSVTAQIAPSDVSDLDLRRALEDLHALYLRKESYFSSPAASQSSVLPEDPIYLFYNENKFSSLYGTRSWWRISNYYGTDTNRLSQLYPLIYNKDGILIWEYKK